MRPTCGFHNCKNFWEQSKACLKKHYDAALCLIAQFQLHIWNGTQ